MITHYLKISIRNLMKYKMQSLISIFGLAVGFVCFALSLWWIQYEMGYDSQHPDVDRRFVYYEKSVHNSSGYSVFTAGLRAREIQEKFPEIKSSQIISLWNKGMAKTETVTISEGVRQLATDSTFIDWSGIRLLKGNLDFLHDDDKAALSEEFAMRLFGTTDVIGKTFTDGMREKTVGAVFSTLEHSNFPFDVWSDVVRFMQSAAEQTFYYGLGTVVYTLHEGIDYREFEAKMRRTEFDKDVSSLSNSGLCPITEFHYSEISGACPVQFYYLILFATVGVLIILAALFNYFSIFVVRLGIRRREISLRKVCGSSWGQLLSLFLTEYTMMLIAAVLLSVVLIHFVQEPFVAISHIGGSIYRIGWSYWFVIWVVTALLLVVLIRYYNTSGKTLREDRLRKWTVASQLTVSIFMLFCMTVLVKQIYFLQTTDLGWNRSTIAVVNVYPYDREKEVLHHIYEFPEVDSLYLGVELLAAGGGSQSFTPSKWDGKTEDAESPSIRFFYQAQTIIPLYGIKLLEGRIPYKDEANAIVLNEAAVKALGMENPVGKHINGFGNSSDTEIVGVVENSYINPPTMPAMPMAFVSEYQHRLGAAIVFKEGQWGKFKRRFDQLMREDYAEMKYEIINMQEYYDQFLYSEHLLVKLLTAVSIVCVLIAAFGIYSLITLSCERRRKEIAIRKVNGAKVKDILFIFIREYVILLVVASVIAFPIGYVLMRQWLVTYVRQTPMSFWIYAVIFVGIALLITLCIGWRVWETSRINPAEVVKSE